MCWEGSKVSGDLTGLTSEECFIAGRNLVANSVSVGDLGHNENNIYGDHENFSHIMEDMQ